MKHTVVPTLVDLGVEFNSEGATLERCVKHRLWLVLHVELYLESFPLLLAIFLFVFSKELADVYIFVSIQAFFHLFEIRKTVEFLLVAAIQSFWKLTCQVFFWVDHRIHL